MSWSNVKDHVPPAPDSDYFKIEDGESARVRMASDPYIYTDYFAQTGKISTRYAVKVWTYKTIVNKTSKLTDIDRPQLLQLSATSFKKIQAIVQDEDWGDPTKYDIKITREGTKTDTVYHFIASPNPRGEMLSKDQRDQVEGLDLFKSVPNAILLSEYDEGKDIPAPAGLNEMAGQPAETTQADNIPTAEDVSKNPINLDEIPF